MLIENNPKKNKILFFGFPFLFATQTIIEKYKCLVLLL